MRNTNSKWQRIYSLFHGVQNCFSDTVIISPTGTTDCTLSQREDRSGFFFFRNFEDVVFFFPSKINLSFLYSWDPFEDYAQSFLSSFNLLLHWTTNRLILNLKRKRVKDVRHVRPSGCSRCINWSCRPSGERHDIKKKVRYVNVLVQSTFKNCRN